MTTDQKESLLAQDIQEFEQKSPRIECITFSTYDFTLTSYPNGLTFSGPQDNEPQQKHLDRA